MPDCPTILTTGDCARLSGMSQNTIIRCIESGDLPAYRLPGSKHRRVQARDFTAWLRRHNVPIPRELQEAQS